MSLTTQNLVIVGGGPSGIYALQRFVQQAPQGSTVFIINPADIGFSGPWSEPGAAKEHLSNIDSSAIPDLPCALHEWLQQKDAEWLAQYGIEKSDINEETFFPRIVDGEFLHAQYHALRAIADSRNITVTPIRGEVVDVEDLPAENRVNVHFRDASTELSTVTADKVLLATGHDWPSDDVPGFYHSPWPIQKLKGKHNCPVGLLGSSLSAIDVAVTKALDHGRFEHVDGRLAYIPAPGTENFSLTMHSRRGVLPHLRHYYEFSQMEIYRYISKKNIECHIENNDGFLSLDYIFENVFKDNLKKPDPLFHHAIENLNLEEFTAHMFAVRQASDPWDLMRQELAEARASLSEKRPIYWKEMLDDVVYTLSFYAKYLSAEDTIRFQEILHPFFSYVSAFMPHHSAERLLALHDAGKLQIVAGDAFSIAADPSVAGADLRYQNKAGQTTDMHYPVLVKCFGQKPRPFKKFPFKSLVDQDVVTPAYVMFACAEAGAAEMKNIQPGHAQHTIWKDGKYYYDIGGVAVNDLFQAMDRHGNPNPRIAIIGIADILGQYPAHPGLAFSDHSATIAMDGLLGVSQSGFFHNPAAISRSRTLKPHSFSSPVYA